MKTSTLVLLGIGVYLFYRRISDSGSGAASQPATPSGNLPLPVTAPYFRGWDLPGANNDPLLVYASYGTTSRPA